MADWHWITPGWEPPNQLTRPGGEAGAIAPPSRHWTRHASRTSDSTHFYACTHEDCTYACISQRKANKHASRNEGHSMASRYLADGERYPWE